MNDDDIDQQLFRELRRRSRPPAVDVARRVLATIQDGRPRPAGLNRWTMAACAALCGAAACIALLAVVAQRFANQASDPAALVINAYDVEVESFMR